MNGNSLISVIIPCFQVEKTLLNTIHDIQQQTYRNLEIIAVDDGSTDQTLSILQKFGAAITAINQKHQGAAAARNRGFAASHGAYVFFCDADVRLNRRALELMQATLAAHPNKAYCYSNFKFGIHTFDLFPFDPARLRKENYISTMSLIRRDCFIGFDESLPRYQDWDLWKRMLNRGFEGVWCPERLFSSPLRGHGISQFSVKNILTLIKRRLHF